MCAEWLIWLLLKGCRGGVGAWVTPLEVTIATAEYYCRFSTDKVLLREKLIVLTVLIFWSLYIYMYLGYRKRH